MNREINPASGTERSFSLRKYLAQSQNKIATWRYSYLFFCFVIPAAIMYLLYMSMGIYPFGDGSVLVLDLNGQYVYFFEALRNAILGDGNLIYSFMRSLGGEFLGMYAYYLASPLSYIVLLFPAARILEALLTIILLKVGLCGLSFGFYLHQNSKNHNKVVSVAFAVMYSLCAYAVVYQSNMMWIDALIWLPLITYGIEQLIKNGKYKLFVISLSLGIMSNYYIGYMLCIFVALYYFYYCFAHTKEELNPNGRCFHIPRSFIRISFFSMVAVAISAFIIVAAYYSLTFGKSDFSNPDWSFKTKFDFLDLLTKLLPGTYDTVRPQGLPFIYCGILPLILLPVYFLTRKISSREKIASLVFIAIFVLSFITKPFDLIWHGFQAPNWLNYRYSFMLTFFILVLAYKGFGNLRSVSERLLLGTSAFIILFATICNKLEFESYVESSSKLLELQTVWLTVIATITLLVLLCLLIRQKSARRRENIAGILAAVVCIEIFCSSLGCIVQYDKDVAYSAYSKYNNFVGDLRPVVSTLKESDVGFYRTEKLVHKKYNDNMALGLYGISGSTSTLNVETIKFLNRMGYASSSHHSQYYGGTPVNDSLLGIKYIIDLENSKAIANYYTPYVTEGKYTAYQNPYALSIAYGVDSAVADFNTERYSSSYEHYFDRLNDMVSSMLGKRFEKDIFIPVDKNDISTIVSQDCQKSSSGLTVTYTPAEDGAYNSVTYTFIADKSAEYYFYAPPKKSAEIEVYVKSEINKMVNDEQDENAEITTIIKTDKKIGKLLGSNTKYIASLGYFDAGETVSITMKLLDDELTVYNNYSHIWYIDSSSFDEAFTMLGENPQFNVTEYTEKHLLGTINTQNINQTIQTTIPYDEGWSVYVDGQKTEIFKTFDALIAFEIKEAGEHTLELKYEPGIYKIGAIISIIGISVFALLCILDVIFYFTVIRKKKLQGFSTYNTSWMLSDFDEDYEKMLCEPELKNESLKERLTRLWQKVISRQTKNKNNTSEGDS